MMEKKLSPFGTFLKSVQTKQVPGVVEAGEVKISSELLHRLLKEHSALPVGELYEESGLGLTEFARVVEDMERFGLVRKAWLDHDRELVELTEKGQRLARSTPSPGDE